MQNHAFWLFAISPLLLLSLGCGDKNGPRGGGISMARSGTDDGNEDVVKIVVMADGTVFVNSETVPVGALGSKLDSLGDIKEVWYHREAPDAAEPHENAMRVVAEIVYRRLPLAVYLDRDFAERASFGQ